MAGRRVFVVMALLAGVTGVGLPSVAAAQEREVYQFDLPAQDLGDALRAVAARAGWELYASADDVNGIVAPRLQGALTARQAIEQLLAGTNLSVRFVKGAVIIRGRSEPAEAASEGESKSDIVVTGSRIRGAPPAAPVTTITAADIRDAGQSDLGEVARSLPQNFGGGQNPGIGNTQGAGVENANVNSASTFNLRGIGPNATLTLLNGNRLSYSGVSAAIDVSTIPVAAVDRVEIVADGASAIYGADAVAGVVNIILKRDYQGLSTTARIGSSTDGGDFQQQYNVVGGTRWSGGGFIATYDYSRNSAINAGQRSYTDSQNPDTTLYPAISRHSLLLSGHQDITADLAVAVDAIYKTGSTRLSTGYLLDGPLTAQGVVGRADFDTFGVAPRLEIKLPAHWTATVSGFYGIDKTTSLATVYDAGTASGSILRKYNNQSLSLEASAQGPIFALPGGDARLAVGGGIRSYRLDAEVLVFDQDISRTRKNYFAYAEAYFPLIGAAQGIPLISRFSVSGAVRYEDYSDSDSIVTPKAGLIYEPFQALSFKASWGRSFKLPTLYQMYSGYSTVLLPVRGYGSTFPAGSTYLYALGANDKDTAEKSENWTLSVEAKPIRGLELTASYFHLDYRDRVAPPLASRTGALTNPIYAELVTLNPTEAMLASLVAGADGGLQNGVGAPYDPSRVVAILDARDRNVARQIYRGVDISARYRADVGNAQTLNVTGSATWLYSKQQLLQDTPYSDLAGTIFRPPHFKARAGATFSSPTYSASSFVSYTGGVRDGRGATSVDIGSVTTVDLTGRVQIDRHMQVSLDVLDLFNAKPKRIPTTSPFDTPFDTTNYSAVGRYVGVRLSRSW